MEKENKVLFNVMYDSIDLFLELKKRSCIFGKYTKNTDKVILCLYLSLILDDSFIKKIMTNHNYEYKLKLKKENYNLTIDEYYAYFVKYFNEFLASNNVTVNTTSNELMLILLNTGVIEKLNIDYNYNHELLKKYFTKRNNLDKVLSKNMQKT